jgi:hypothetical protein
MADLYDAKATEYVAKIGPRPLKMPKAAAKVIEAPAGQSGMVNGVTFTKTAEGWKNPQGKVVMSKSILDKLNATPATEVTPQEGGQSGAQPESFRGGTGEVKAEEVKPPEPPTESRNFGPGEALKYPLEHNPLTFLHKSEAWGVKPSFDVAAEAHDILGPRFANAMNEAYIKKVAMDNKSLPEVEKILKGTSIKEQELMGKYLYNKKYGTPQEELPPKLQAKAEQVQTIVAGANKNPEAPFVSEVKNGKLVERP